ncbi:hypothetical protein IAU60_004886 [Kwoniella sp. DSM 27419]
MAVMLRSQMDLLYLVDNGYAGQQGAIRILPQITPQIRRLDLSHNLMGSSGVVALCQGLTTLRARSSAAEGAGPWGLTSISLSTNALDDVALGAVLAYAKKDVYLRQVLLQGNRLTLRTHLPAVVNSINASRVEKLSLTNNLSLDPASVSDLFDSLDSPHLQELQLSTCDLPPSVCPSIARFLRSSRSRAVRSVHLNGNHLGAMGVREIVDAVEQDNYTILDLGLLSNALEPGALIVDENSVGGQVPRQRDVDGAEAMMDYQNHQRLPAVLQRNRDLTRRVRQAACRVIAPARIVFNATRPSDEDTAQRVISDVSSGASYGSFRLLDLPEEVVTVIVRYMSFDGGALSQAQWTRLRKEAMDRDSLRRAARATQERFRGLDRGERQDEGQKLRQEWLGRGGWDRWER